MREYSWKSTSYSNVDAQLVGEELEKLEFAGQVSSEEVLKFAKNNPDSELYKCFEWDDTEAAEKYRRVQASQIICSIAVTIKEEPKQTQKVYFSIKTTTDNERTFKNIKEILKEDGEYQQLIDKAKRSFINCKEKYETLLEREDLKDVIYEIYKEV